MPTFKGRKTEAQHKAISKRAKKEVDWDELGKRVHYLLTDPKPEPKKKRLTSIQRSRRAFWGEEPGQRWRQP